MNLIVLKSFINEVLKLRDGMNSIPSGLETKKIRQGKKKKNFKEKI